MTKENERESGLGAHAATSKDYRRILQQQKHLLRIEIGDWRLMMKFAHSFVGPFQETLLCYTKMPNILDSHQEDCRQNGEITFTFGRLPPSNSAHCCIELSAGWIAMVQNL